MVCRFNVSQAALIQVCVGIRDICLRTEQMAKLFCHSDKWRSFSRNHEGG